MVSNELQITFCFYIDISNIKGVISTKRTESVKQPVDKQINKESTKYPSIVLDLLYDAKQKDRQTEKKIATLIKNL